MIGIIRRRVQVSVGVAILWTLAFVVVTAVGADSGMRTWWALAQPDPYITARAEPIPNGNVDANGLTPAQWAARGGTSETWIAMPKTTFARGDTMYVWRFDCFFNKVDGVVSRVFIGEGNTITQLPDVNPPKRTATGQCSAANFSVPIPKDIPLGKQTYAPYVTFFKNPTERVPVWFRPVTVTVVDATATR